MVKVDDFAADVALLVENGIWSRSGAGLLGARADPSRFKSLHHPPSPLLADASAVETSVACPESPGSEAASSVSGSDPALSSLASASTATSPPVDAPLSDAVASGGMQHTESSADVQPSSAASLEDMALEDVEDDTWLLHHQPVQTFDVFVRQQDVLTDSVLQTRHRLLRTETKSSMRQKQRRAKKLDRSTDAAGTPKIFSFFQPAQGKSGGSAASQASPLVSGVAASAPLSPVAMNGLDAGDDDSGSEAETMDAVVAEDEQDDDEFVEDFDWGTRTEQFNEATARLVGFKMESRNRAVESQVAELAGHDDELRHLDFLKLWALKLLFAKMHQRDNVMEASRAVAEGVFLSFGANARLKAMSIRRWARHFIEYGTLPPFKQGCHQKADTWFADEDVERKVRDHLNLTFADKVAGNGFTAKKLQAWVQATFQKDISESSALRALHALGFEQSALGGMFVDGHERADVQAYRIQFVRRFGDLTRRMTTFEKGSASDELMTIAPQLQAGERELVPITHDECVAKANDSCTKRWAPPSPRQRPQDRASWPRAF
jgi:hypothetical protein